MLLRLYELRDVLAPQSTLDRVLDLLGGTFIDDLGHLLPLDLALQRRLGRLSPRRSVRPLGLLEGSRGGLEDGRGQSRRRRGGQCGPGGLDI
jgi:hypothetical protein